MSEFINLDYAYEELLHSTIKYHWESTNLNRLILSISNEPSLVNNRSLTQANKFYFGLARLLRGVR